MIVHSGGLEERVFALFASDPATMADPYPTWNELRDIRPATRMRGTVVLSRHHDVRELLADNNVLYSRERTRHAVMYEQARERFGEEQRVAFDSVMDQEFRQLVRLDPPDHPRQRKVVRAPFSHRALVRDMEAKVTARVTAGLDELRRAGANGAVVDFKRFAYTLPFQVIGDLLGIALTDLDTVHGWARSIADNKFNADSALLAVEADAAYSSLMGYIDALVSDRRRTGTATGLVASLIDAEQSGQVRRDEVGALLGLMIFAGHETTSGLLTVGMLELLRHPAQWAILCEDPSLSERAVEELLRFVTPVQFLPYIAIAEREIGGVRIADGDTVIGVLAAANRDPGVFSRPDELDLLRPDSDRHLGFGLGPHFCLGSGLARMEATQIFRALAGLFPRSELAATELQWGGRSLRTPLHLPLRLV